MVVTMYSRNDTVSTKHLDGRAPDMKHFFHIFLVLFLQVFSDCTFFF